MLMRLLCLSGRRQLMKTLKLCQCMGAPFSDWPKPEEFKPVTINPPDSLKTKLLELIEAVLGIKLQKPEVLKVQALAA